MKTKIKLNQTNKQAFDAFMLHDKAVNSNTLTLANHAVNIRMFLSRLKTNWNEATQEVIDDFFANTNLKDTSKEVIKTTIKAFYRYHGKKIKDKGLKIKDNDMIEKGDSLVKVADMIISNPKILARPTKDKESVLTPDEIERVIECHHDLGRKAFMETFITTGARKDEIRMLNLGDVTFDGNLVWVNIRKPKTTSPNIKPRNIPIAPSPDNPVARFPTHLVAWVQARKNEDRDRPLFVSNSYQRQFNGNRISEQGIYNIFLDIKLKAGIKRKLTPHILRHTGATYDGKVLNESMLCQKYGWVIGSNMARRYCHFSEKVLGEQILRRAGLKHEDEKKGKVCPRCGEPNNLFADECSKCHQVLNAKQLLEQEASKDQKISKLESQVDLMEQMMKQVIDKIGINLDDTEAYQEYQKSNPPSETIPLPDDIKKEIKSAGNLKNWSKKKLAEQKAKTKQGRR